MSSISRAWPLAVSATSTSTPASTSAVARSQASPKKPIAAATRSRPSASLVACGYFSVLTKSLTVISPRQPAGVVDQRQLLDLVLGEQRGGVVGLEMPTGAVTSGIGVISSRTVRVANSSAGTKSRSRLVMMPSRVRSAVDHRQAGDAVAARTARRARRGSRRG